MGQAKHAPTTRRTILAQILALSSAAGASAIVVAHGAALADPIRADEHEDAHLLALEAPILALAAITDEIGERMHRLEKAAFETSGPRPTSLDWDSAEWKAARARTEVAKQANGYEEAERLFIKADNELLAATRLLERTPARTFDGVRMKARLAVYGDADLAEAIVEDIVAIDKAMRA